MDRNDFWREAFFLVWAAEFNARSADDRAADPVWVAGYARRSADAALAEAQAAGRVAPPAPIPLRDLPETP